jgi:hypothetical protein
MTGRIRARATWVLLGGLAAGGPGAAAAQDLDGDAIPDAIEEQSWYQNAGGSPQRQDVWVECDYMAGTVKKRGLLRHRAEQVFERAPVPGGIALHLVFDDKLPFEQQWGDVQTNEGVVETYARLLETYQARFDAAPFTGGNAQTMRSYVHYCVFVNAIDSEGVSGLSWDSRTIFSGIPADLFIVALGQYQGELPGSFMRRAEVGVLLHELGHNLSLTHGGARPRPHANHKPNYLSVMNYHHTFGFLRLVDSGAEFFPYWDYSRARSSLVHERRLREMDGIALPETAAFTDNAAGDELLGLTYCPDEALAAFRWNRPVNFDCDQAFDAGKVKVDTNLDGRKNKLGRVQVDWDHLVYDGGALGDGPGLARSLVLDPLDEADRETIERLLREFERVERRPVERPDRP